ncbi:MAG TPA: chorismate synthase [Thermoplasmata archaeon]|nr:chorismate synthase [Thermoplasmata archaeon]
MEFDGPLRLKLTGTSHGPSVGCELRGLPRGFPIDLLQVQAMLDRRAPVGRRVGTRRREEDRLIVRSGLNRGRTNGGTFRAEVANTDVRRSDYDRMRDLPRPGHADFPARVRFGEAADLSGGGPFSGRMTVGIVIGGAICAQLLRPIGIEVVAFAREIGGVRARVAERARPAELIRAREANEVSSADPAAAAPMLESIARARRGGDSVGGIVEARGYGVPVGWGEPFFDSIESVLAHLLFSVPGVKAVEFGAGARVARLRGSTNNDPWIWRNGRVVGARNRAGGILGGLATGMPIVVRAAFKPTPSIAKPQRTVDLRTRAAALLRVSGRHDPCIVPRAVVVVESAVLLGLAEIGLAGGFLP